MASFVDAAGASHEVPLDVNLYRQANDRGQSVEAFLNTTYQTSIGGASAFEQLCASEGLMLGRDQAFGIRPDTMDMILNGPKQDAASVVREAVPASRILYPAFQMAAIENKLRANDYGVVTQFESAAAVVDTIANEKFERPILNFSKPEAARSRGIAQLSEPASMLSITASDKSWRITGTSIGMEISDQALRASSLDLVTLAVTRQAEVEQVERTEGQFLAFLNGDVDVDQGPLSGVAGAVFKANAFDATIVAAGTLTQKAWVKWLFNNNRKRTITHIMTDLDTALAIQNRAGRPVIVGDNGTSPRIDTLEQIVNPAWPDTVKLFITQDPAWPANTIMGWDQSYGYHIVNSSTLTYEAVQNYLIRRSSVFRYDRGSIAYRLFDEAWSVLTLTL